MPALYSATQTLINTDTTLTPDQFEDRADAFCEVLTKNDLVYFVDVVVVSNRELDVTVIADVPNGIAPVSYFETTIGPLAAAALDMSGLQVTSKTMQHAPADW